jgi:hypothetical protein
MYVIDGEGRAACGWMHKHLLGFQCSWLTITIYILIHICLFAYSAHFTSKTRLSDSVVIKLHRITLYCSATHLGSRRFV